MNDEQWNEVALAEKAALKVLHRNSRGPCRVTLTTATGTERVRLPRTAGWGYPEPYTRDLLICGLGALAMEDPRLMDSLRAVLETLARNQTAHGHITSLVHDPEDRGASDTTPLFLMITALYRAATGDQSFLSDAVEKSLTWMDYRSEDDGIMVTQMPTSDWRDEMWVIGYGLYVNCIVYAYLCLLGMQDKANELKKLLTHFTVDKDRQSRHVHEGLAVRHVPYYALWSYKIYSNRRFDLLGNSLAVLTGIEPQSRANYLIHWIENECQVMRQDKLLNSTMPPNLFPFIYEGDPDWIPRYEMHNHPGDYHNGGIWPFICGFYVAAIVAAGKYRLAERKLLELTQLVKLSHRHGLEYGFNEWMRAQDGTPRGQDWQSWSAAMYLYAAQCVRRRKTIFFDGMRSAHLPAPAK